MQLFRLTDHREILKSLIAARKGEDRPLHFSALAERIGTQKTYVSKVMAGDGCWNADQAFLIAEAFELSADEEEYFCLLVELERSGSEGLRVKTGDAASATGAVPPPRF